MKLFEYEAKEILRSLGVPTPKGQLATTPEEAEEAARKIAAPVAVKSQVLAGGRGKAGGIKFANTPEEARKVAAEVLGMSIKGIKVDRVLVEEKIPITHENYLGITVDRAARAYVALACGEGGVEIEEVAARSPEKIIRYHVNPADGLRPFKARTLAGLLGYRSEQKAAVASALSALYRVVMNFDAELAEINPFVETASGVMLAADARILIDDNALFRHKAYEERLLERQGELSPREAEARKHDVAYVDLDGNVGIIGNGAGLVMATLDLVQLFGGKPANFLDVGGGASAEVVRVGLKLVLSKPEVERVVVNILGGITHCDEVAKGIVQALSEAKESKPLFTRIVGTREEEARRILQEANIKVFDSMEEVVKNAVSGAGV